MRRLLAIFVFLTALQINVSAQDTATVTGVLKNIAGHRVAKVQLKITPLVVAGQAVSSIPYFTPASDASGNVSFTVLKNSTINIQGNALRFTGTGSNYEIKDDDAISLDALVALASVPTSGVTVYDETTPLSGLFGTFKFVGDGVTATRSSAGIVTVTIPGGSGSVDWADILNKPSSFTPSAHASTHASAGSDPLTLSESQITNLVSDLAGKAAASHTHAESDVTGLVSDLAAKVPTSRTVNGHALSSNVTVTPADLSLVIGADVQAWSANLDSWSAKTPYSGSLSITSGKMATFGNTLTFSGTDGSTLNVGTGGTLGSNAFTSTAYAPAARAVNTTSPLAGGGALTGDLTLTCSTCTTNAATLTANMPLIGAGGNATAVGTRSGNTTEFATSTGTKTTGKQLQWDASGNVVASSSDIGGGASGASAALDNLASVSINTSLIPQTGINLGAQATPFKNLWIYGGGTFGSHSIKFDGTPTGNRVVTFPDASITVARADAAQTFTGVQTFSSPPTSPNGSSTFPDEIFGASASGGGSVGGGSLALFGTSARGFWHSVAVGNGANASSGGNRDDGTALGFTALVAGNNGTAVGSQATASVNGTAVGFLTNAPSASIALGSRTAATNANHFVAGSTTANANNITDVYIGSGVTDATPTASTYHGTGGNGSNIAGADITIAGGASTGTGAGGNFMVKTSPSGSSGSTANTLIARYAAKAKGVALTSGSAASVVDVTLPTLAMTGGTISYTIIATDGTDMQALSGQVIYSAVNKGGSYTTSIKTPGGATADDTTAAKSVSTGTLTLAWSITTGTNAITIKATPTTSLTATKFLLYYTVINNSEQAITPD